MVEVAAVKREERRINRGDEKVEIEVVSLKVTQLLDLLVLVAVRFLSVSALVLKLKNAGADPELRSCFASTYFGGAGNGNNTCVSLPLST